MDHLTLYNALAQPPQEALRAIEAGRMKGKTDINPMWRIKALTQQFGPCGIGWKYEITRQWLEPGAQGEVSAFCNILLYYKWDNQWSEGVPGTGGSAFVAKERGGLYQSDECYKMALTDAISVAAKALGVAGNVYWQNDPGKYSPTPRNHPPAGDQPTCQRCGAALRDVKGKDGRVRSVEQIAEYSQKKYGRIFCLACQKDERNAKEKGENYA